MCCFLLLSLVNGLVKKIVAKNTLSLVQLYNENIQDSNFRPLSQFKTIPIKFLKDVRKNSNNFIKIKKLSISSRKKVNFNRHRIGHSLLMSSTPKLNHLINSINRLDSSLVNHFESHFRSLSSTTTINE